MSELIDRASSCLALPECFEQADADGLAAVLLLLVESAQGPQILFTERAAHLRHHPGEISLPGGMWEQGDRFPVDTALREAFEEVALPAQQVRVLGLLPTFPTRARIEVTPVVGFLEAEPVLQANRDEVESLFWVPLDFFLEDKRLRTDVFSRGKTTVWAPAYEYQGKVIWGFTAGVVKIFLNQCLSAGIVRDNPAPEKNWSVNRAD